MSKPIPSEVNVEKLLELLDRNRILTYLNISDESIISKEVIRTYKNRIDENVGNPYKDKA